MLFSVVTRTGASTPVMRRNLLRLVRYSSSSAPQDTFVRRHIGPQDGELSEMLKTLGHSSLESFTEAVVPKHLAFKKELWTDPPKTESELLEELQALGRQNKVVKSFIGLGYYGTKTPSVIIRNMLESPGWYTAYTPYQAEIAQGRLESMLNFQTMVEDLTGLPVANASLLDEGTAAGETVGVAVAFSKHKCTKYFIDRRCHPQTIECVRTRAQGLGVQVVVGDYLTFKFEEHPGLGGVCVQYPDTTGEVRDYAAFFAKAKQTKALCVVVTDLLALCLLKPPGEFGADLAVGSTQRFGVPPGFGGPHAAFLACADPLKRLIPGRIIGVSRDAQGNTAFRMALQTREQHIKREKATSNICTSQALLANMAAMYAVYHGPKGLKGIATQVHTLAKTLAEGLRACGHTVVSKVFFDTIEVKLQGISADEYIARCLSRGYNLRQLSEDSVAIALDETACENDVGHLLEAAGAKPTCEVSVGCGCTMAVPAKTAENAAKAAQADILAAFSRTTPYLTHPVFNSYHCEMEMQRYLYRLERRDLGLNTAMIPLGSCTMKLTGASTILPITWKEFGSLHPFVPADQATGYRKLIAKLEERLCAITGFQACSMQSNSGAQGEYNGLRCIMAYHRSRGDTKRNVCLIPISAHGTNPASAVMAAMKLVVVKCDASGNVDLADLKARAEEHRDSLACLMITYPSTHGVYEDAISDICAIVHANGGQVYMDGANLNAQAGVMRPAELGADVCHINLHKTFAIPHGGGGPGMGPICCKAHLAPFLPHHVVVPGVGGAKAYGQVSAAPWGSASILPISYAYIEMMGAEGIRRATQISVLNANYLARRLSVQYKVLYTNGGHCAHEFILDVRPFKTVGVEAEDIAKRLMDYNFHAPTLSFPVPGTLMIEPTESESKFELDRFVEALLLIREEIREVEEGKADRFNNVLKNAPHTARVLAGDWTYPYSRQKAVFPTRYVMENKYWPSVGRIDNTFGDRNFFCCIPDMETYSAH
eukprot:RCo048177